MMRENEDRLVMTWVQVCSAEVAAGGRPQQAYMKCSDFLKMVEIESGQSVSRRTLQFYTTPEVGLMPPPAYVDGHTAVYLHPEHTQRLAVIARLRSAYFLPLKLVRRIMEKLPTRLYDLVLRSVVQARDILQLIERTDPYQWPREQLFHRAKACLMAAYGPGNPGQGWPGEQEALADFRIWLGASAPQARPNGRASGPTPAYAGAVSQ